MQSKYNFPNSHQDDNPHPRPHNNLYIHYGDFRLKGLATIINDTCATKKRLSQIEI